MTDDEKSELADVYEKAAGYLEEYGWRQGEQGGWGASACLVGALVEATGHEWPLTAEARITAEDVLELGPMVESELVPLAKWNDDPTRTKDEVINTLHALANKLR